MRTPINKTSIGIACAGENHRTLAWVDGYWAGTEKRVAQQISDAMRLCEVELPLTPQFRPIRHTDHPALWAAAIMLQILGAASVWTQPPPVHLFDTLSNETEQNSDQM